MGLSNRYLLFNDMTCTTRPGTPTACGVVLDRHTGRRTRTLPKPVVGVSQDGRLALSVSLQRLEIARPGAYGAARVFQRMKTVTSDL